jgi:hypothetical protein
MDFDIAYEYVDSVSVNDYKERIKVRFAGMEYFAADDGQHIPSEEATV